MHLGEQTALADPRLAGDEHDAARARARGLENLADEGQLGRAPDEIDLRPVEPPPLARLGARTARYRRCHGNGLALQLDGLFLTPFEQRLELAPRVGVGEHRAGLGRRLEPRGGVDRVAEGGVLDARTGSDRSQHHRPRRDADPDAETVDAPAALDLACIGSHLVDDPQAGSHRPFGVVLVGDRGSEECEHPVAGEILHAAAEPLDLEDDPRDRLADDELHLFGLEPLAEGRGADEVREHGRDDLALLAELGSALGLPLLRHATF